jgi:hypothetical protein
MIESVKKGSIGLYISYSDGNFTSNLYGRNFQFEQKDNEIIFSIDLTKNIKTRNKQMNSYIDIMELKEKNR